MKGKRLLCGFLSAALLLGSLAWPAPAAQAAQPDLENGLTGYYSFDDGTLVNSRGENQEASAITKGLGGYDGNVTYEENGKSGKAVRLVDYGLQLNQKDLGDEFTVSMWLKPNSELVENQNVLFLGYHDPENWFSVAGNAAPNATSAECKVWANGGEYKWKTFDTVTMASGNWHCLTLPGTSSTLTAYLNGEQVASGNTNHPLTGMNQDIYVGVTNWDKAFPGLVDEVRVYNRTLTEGELYQLYDNRAPEQILEEKGITVTKSLTMPVKRSESIEVQMPAVVREYGASVSFESSAPDVASVDRDGKVTAHKDGTAKITVTVTLNGVTKTAETAVTVAGTVEDSLTAHFEFEGNLDNGKGGQGAQAFVKGLTAGGNIAYADTGHTGKALSLNNYGLKLNQVNLGSEYTVSFWLKPNRDQAGNQCVLFLNRGGSGNNDQHWMALSGDAGSTYKIWAKGGSFQSHTTLFSPRITAQEWHQVTLTGTAGTVTAYVDGVKLGTSASNDPLSAAASDIYLGVNYWDAEFDGLMDDVKVYGLALNEEEIQSQAETEFNTLLGKKLQAEITLKNILGSGNTDADGIKYDLRLPVRLDGIEVSWESSHPQIIQPDGTVSNPSAATEVTLTAKAKAGMLQASAEYKVKVAVLERAELDALIAQAEALDTSNTSEVSGKRLQEAIAEAKAADSFSKVKTATEHLRVAMERLCPADTYVNPFAKVTEPPARALVRPNEARELFTLPENVKDAVDVTYVSGKPEIVTYADGRITGVAEGKAVVTAEVTARSDGWKMKYSTAVDVTASGPAGDYGDVLPEDIPEDGVIPEGVWIGGLAKAGYPYTGSAVTPAVRVYRHKTRLTADTDYTLRYENNTDAGTASVTVLGTGEEQAVLAKAEFTIQKADQSLSAALGEATIKIGQKTNVTIIGGGIGMPTYRSSNEQVAAVSPGGEVTGMAEGTAEITVSVSGDRNHNPGSASVTVTVTGESVIHREGFTVDPIPDQLYTGAAVKPEPQVYHDDTKLIKGVDYTVSYKNNVKAAVAEEAGRKAPVVIVKGKGLYTNKMEVPFTIRKPELTEKNLIAAKRYPEKTAYTPVVMMDGSVLKSGRDYKLEYQDSEGKKLKSRPNKIGSYFMKITGKGSCAGEFTFSYEIVAKDAAAAQSIAKMYATVDKMVYGGTEPAISLSTKKTNGAVLERHVDYEVIFANTGAKGTATATFVGIGDYTGILKKKFKVEADVLEDGWLSAPESASYKKGGSKPDVVLKAGDRVLVKGVDYTVSYKNNGKLSGDKDAQITVKGRGNYTGTLTRSFKVGPEDLQALANEGRIYVSDVVKKKKPSVTVYDSNGKKLSAGGDYKLEIDKNACTVTITSGKKGLYTAAEPIVISYRELEKSQIVTSVTLNKRAEGFPKQFEYTGREIELDKSWLKVKAGRKVLGTDEFEILGYVNNVEKGTATVIICGTGEYSGTRMLNFKIQSRRMVRN